MRRVLAPVSKLAQRGRTPARLWGGARFSLAPAGFVRRLPLWAGRSRGFEIGSFSDFADLAHGGKNRPRGEVPWGHGLSECEWRARRRRTFAGGRLWRRQATGRPERRAALVHPDGLGARGLLG